MAYYISPFVVQELPPNTSATAFVSEWDRAASGATGRVFAFAPEPLDRVEASFFSDRTSAKQLLLLIGEGGTGKSTCLMQLGNRLLADCEKHLPVSPANHQPMPWTPLLVELRRYSVADLFNLLPLHLERCGVDPGVVDALRQGAVPLCGGAPALRLVLLCDGADEMVDGGDGADVLRDFVARVCGGVAWPNSTLRVVVTSRGYVLSDCPVRRVLLPFGRAQVRPTAREVVL